MENISSARTHHTGRFFDSSSLLRLVIVWLITVAVFLFVHNRAVRVPSLELGTVASQYVVAEVPFKFVDEEMTTAARHAAVIDVGKIFEISSEDILKRKMEFEALLLKDQWWRRIMTAQSSLDEMYRASEQFFDLLEQIRFSDVRTIERMRQAGIDVVNFHEIAPIDLRLGICFTDKIWEFVRRRAFGDGRFQPAAADFLISTIRDKIWILRVDNAMTRKVRKQLRQNVPATYSFVDAGTRIIDSGEKVTSRHMAKLVAMKKELSLQRDLWHPKTILGSLILTAVIVFVGGLFFRCYHREILKSNTTMFLIVTIVLLGMGSVKLFELFLLHSSHDLVDSVRSPLLTPFVGILLCILVNPSVAIFIVAVLAVLFDGCSEFRIAGFLIQNLLVGFVVIFYTRTLRRRAEIVGICLKGWAVASLIVLGVALYKDFSFPVVCNDIVGAGFFMLLTAVVVVGLLPLFESCFHILTDINLMEYMNPNNELLQRLMVEAPGTYQHAVLVGSIAEAAAQAIGANGLFCRVATLYHDIGKVSIAQYFTENQQSGMNIHQLLTPVESARVIISHVQEGVNLARKAGLPESFISMIREHHGTSLVYYFYHEQLKSVGHDTSKVDEREFRYAGPKPRSKEAAILMIADSFEAACRSVEEMTEEILQRLVDQIVREKVEDGQLDDCILSFEELGKAKKAMVKALMSVGHFRIKYPAKVKVSHK